MKIYKIFYEAELYNYRYETRLIERFNGVIDTNNPDNILEEIKNKHLTRSRYIKIVTMTIIDIKEECERI